MNVCCWPDHRAVVLIALVSASTGGGAAGSGRWQLESRVGVELASADESQGSAVSGASVAFSPGIRAVANGARVKGFLDYGLVVRQGASVRTGADLRHQLNGSGQLEVLDDALFLDLSGVVSRQPVSALGPQPVVGRDEYKSQTINGRFSPYVKGVLPGAVSLETRYSAEGVKNQANKSVDSLGQTLSVRVAQQSSPAWGWSLNMQREQVAYRGGRRDLVSSQANGSVSYALTPQWQVHVDAGYESSNQSSATWDRHQVLGGGVVWRASDRSSVAASATERQFGTAHDVSAQYAWARGLIRISDSRSVSTMPASTVAASLGSLYDLLDTLLSATESDPVARARLVEDELRRRGLPADLQVSTTFLTAGATVQRRQQASLALRWPRQTLMLSVNRQRANRITNGLSASPDEFDVASAIRGTTWSLAASHRLTPRVSLSATLTRQENVAASSSSKTGSQSAQFGINSLLTPRTSGALQIRNTRSMNDLDPFEENALVGNLLHRF